jgi:hypothetical protein
MLADPAFANQQTGKVFVLPRRAALSEFLKS